jgi:phosphoribosylformylglycinamidine cyclo-ligase
LFFLDYYATGKLDLKNAKSFLTSVRDACIQSDCALIGGETAEMPGVYHGNDFDCAGFAVGVVDEEKRWGPHKVKQGDHIFALSSSGFHSNGYSLLRKVFEKDLNQWREILLTPTRLYVEMALEVAKVVDVHAAAHITGGGIDNIPRVLPEGWTWEKKNWPWPEAFKEVQKRTGMSDQEMLTSLNCGIGFCFVIDPNEEPALRRALSGFKVDVYDLGQVHA